MGGMAEWREGGGARHRLDLWAVALAAASPLAGLLILAASALGS